MDLTLLGVNFCYATSNHIALATAELVTCIVLSTDDELSCPQWYIWRCILTDDKDIKHTEDLFILCERIFSIGGVWSSKNNSSYIKFTIYCAYYVSFLTLSYVDLFEIIGNLQLTVMNMVETVVYTITFMMILVIRFSSLLREVIEITKQNIREYRFENNDEKIIYNTYHYVSKIFFKVSNICMIITVTLSYIRPLMNFAISSVKDNSTNIYILPVRIYTFFELSNTRDYILFYLYLLPIIYMSMCHMTAICVLVNLVLYICADLSILAYRIRNIAIISEKDVHHRIRFLIKMHYKTICMKIYFFHDRIAKSLDDALNIVLLDELLGNSIVLAISMYYVLIVRIIFIILQFFSYDTSEIATSCTFIFFSLTALTMLYGFCVIGDQLTEKVFKDFNKIKLLKLILFLFQSQNVLDAYYECNWQDMSCSTKKSLLICMIRAQKYLYLTGGKFYIFSLIGFTDVSLILLITN
ncbi:PREDICTED: uncharacterized protein LOC107067895 [Polistes dominula]|uniref:Odorant receptor n=1 Tax=Polistes dominula TaxID=743375 RepID=A0ABM1IGG7_POLDO|nr:PREDICTED: uncharacterized protein LOC107067895 [Polistes dominula]